MNIKLSFICISLFFSLPLPLYSQTPPPPPLYPGEVWTGMYSISYGFQSSSSTRQIIRDHSNPANLYSVMTAMKDTINGSDSRAIYGAYSTDFGLTWTNEKIGPTNSRQAYLNVIDGIPCFSFNSDNGSSKLFKGRAFNSFLFSEIPGIPTAPQNMFSFPKWVSVYGNSIFLSSMYYDFFNNIINGSFYNGNTWSDFVPFSISGTVYDVSSNGDSIVYVTGVDDKIPLKNPNYPLVFHKSTNGGISFTPADTIVDYILEGNDTLEIFSSLDGGTQSLVINDELHVVFVAAVDGPELPNQGHYVPNVGIYHWSELTGISKIGGRNNILNLEDSLSRNSIYKFPITQSTIGKTINGTLICAFIAYLDRDTQTVENGMVFNTGEVFYSYSNDNGSTWSNPNNLTHTPGIDEQYPSLMRENYTDSLHIYYFRDMIAGAWNTFSITAPTYAIFNRSSAPVGIQNISQEIPIKFNLLQNYPNPFNPETNIAFDIPQSGFVKLTVFDIAGREITKLVNGELQTGTYLYSWDASVYPSGVYFYKLEAGDFSETKRMVLVK
jgi:hypothetical protein